MVVSFEEIMKVWVVCAITSSTSSPPPPPAAAAAPTSTTFVHTREFFFEDWDDDDDRDKGAASYILDRWLTGPVLIVPGRCDYEEECFIVSRRGSFGSILHTDLSPQHLDSGLFRQIEKGWTGLAPVRLCLVCLALWVWRTARCLPAHKRVKRVVERKKEVS